MEHIGIDIHKRESQICILTPEGEIIERRIQSTREKFTAVFTARPRARVLRARIGVLLEATTESEWVAQTLEAGGHEVIVADPNYAPMYPERRRRVKTDRRDARMLAEAARVGSYRPPHRVSAEQRQVRRQLRVRDLLVRARGRTISLIRALVRSEGLRVPGDADRFGTYLSELDQSRVSWLHNSGLLGGLPNWDLLTVGDYPSGDRNRISSDTSTRRHWLTCSSSSRPLRGPAYLDPCGAVALASSARAPERMPSMP